MKNSTGSSDSGRIAPAMNTNMFDHPAVAKNLETLMSVLTAGAFRMSDDERLSAIDTLHEDMEDKLGFLRHFNSRTKVLLLQRLKEQNNINTTRKIYGLTY